MKQDNNNNKANKEIVYSLNDILESRYGRYAKYIIQERALPDVRDGLKPVQRRILFAMQELNLTHQSSYKKSARVVGEVIGKYHPHGDSSIYEAMVRLSQSWKLRYPLIDMHGNNGSIDGDPAAAMRYTEAKLSFISSFLLADLNKKTVPFIPNFDDSEKEPTVLPSYLPNLLLNGSTGIAAGYATNIPPHNINEVINAIAYRIKHPNSKLKDIMKYIKGPDFPTRGIIQGKQGIIDAYKTGKGKIIIRSKVEVLSDKIIVTEIPYEVVKQDLIRKIDDIKYKEQGLNIDNVRDETDRHGLRIVIELKKEANSEIVRKYLFKNTNLQISYNINLVAIANKTPKLLGLLDILDHYISHQVEITTKRVQFDLAKAENRKEIVEGLIKAVSVIDEIIAIIRKSKDRTNAIDNLVKRFKFTKTQAEAIVQLRLYRLTSTDIVELQKENEELSNLIKELQSILDDSNKLNEVIINNLNDIKRNFSSERLSKIEDDVEQINIDEADTIVEKDISIWVSRDGYLKALDYNQLTKISQEDFARKPNDIWLANLSANTLDRLLLITSKGNYVIVPVHKIKMSRIKEIGVHVNSISELDGEEKIIACYLIDEFAKENISILLATKAGYIKYVDINDFAATRISKAIRAIKLKNPDDEVVSSQLYVDQQYLVVVTKNGFVAKYRANDVPLLGLVASGVKSVNLKDDEVVSAYLANNDHITIFASNYKTKKIAVNKLSLFNRPVKGERLFKNNKKETIYITWALLTRDKDMLSILNSENEIIKLNVNKIKLAKIDDDLVASDIIDIVDVVIEKYYNVKQFPNKSELLESKKK